MSAKCRFCCKSLFAQMITNFPSCRRGFRINMLGTSSHSDELTGDFGNEPEAISIGDHGLSRLLAEKLSPRDLGLLQQNLPQADIADKFDPSGNDRACMIRASTAPRVSTQGAARTKRLKRLERVKGIEPSSSAWKAVSLPLSYTRAVR